MSIANVRCKANVGYVCTQCGQTELIQAHHRVPGDDDSIIVLCGWCHAVEHPDLALGLFLTKTQQPYWYGISASSIAKGVGVCSRTVIRTAKRLGIGQGELSEDDHRQIKAAIRSRYPNLRVNRSLLASFPDRPTLTIYEATQIFCVHRNTISRWLREGVLHGKRRAGTQKIHLDRQDVERLARGE